jgi:hypothetical protein
MPRNKQRPSRRRQRRRQRTRKPQQSGPAQTRTRAPKTDALQRCPLFPASVRRRGQLYYETALGLTAPTSGNAVTYFFSANGMFDPNITGTGHQPIGFDQMMLMYEQCTVINSSIQVTFNVGPGLTINAGVALFPDATGLTNPSQLVENGLIRYIPLTSGSTTFQNHRPQSIVRLDCNVAKYFGRRGVRVLLNDDNLYTTAAANPVEQVYYGIVAWQISPDGSTTTALGFDVLISYDVIYWEPRKLTES